MFIGIGFLPTSFPNDPSTEIYWSMVGAVGQILGAIATFLAVLVALYQSYDAKKASEPKLKISISTTMIVYNNGHIGEPFYSITASNPKSFPIVIMSAGVKIGNRNVTFLDNAIFKHENYPKKLEQGDHTTVWLDYKKLAEFLYSQGLSGKQKCYIYFSDSLNNEFKKPFRLNINDVISQGK
jgi:hypothetical protein